ncbi:MAG: hypothetical protein CVU06_04035 [Bacteroidetes bacterium HGW-Bacteroidetes-22]|nr:MAG: hypothetical protein CVU06_04035 [Bacteroidetes bacterium HGW-Bacteroidetes-22]
MIYRKIILLAFAMMGMVALNAQISFSDYFESKTLRIDFELGGNDTLTMVFLKEMKQEPYWGGPVKNLTDPFGYGNFRYRVYDAVTGLLIFERGFGSLFEEWKATPDSDRTHHGLTSSSLMLFF